MNLFIPEVGTTLKLSEDWTFTLAFQYRNESFVQAAIGGMFNVPPELRVFHRHYSEKDKSIIFALKDTEYKDQAVIRTSDFPKDYPVVQHNNLNGVRFTLPKGTELKIDRIYVRKGKADYSSLTFNVVSTTHPFLVDKKGKKKKGLRFWSTLDDVHSMEFEIA
jgi:hypothetical protein